jgi:hypothetical protein
VAPEPEGSSPQSQQPASDPYPEPGKSTPHPPTNLSKVHFDPILPSISWSCRWSLSFGLSHRNPVHVSPLSLVCDMPLPPHSAWFDLPSDIWWWVHVMKLPIMQLSPLSRYFIPLGSKHSPQYPVLKHPQFSSLKLAVRYCKFCRFLIVSNIWSKSSAVVNTLTFGTALCKWAHIMLLKG